MAVAITGIFDSLGNDLLAGGCYEEVADGNVAITISTTESLDTTSIENFSGYVPDSLVDNLDGSFTFEVEKESIVGQPCLTITEFIPQDCLTVCPLVDFNQTIDGANYSTNYNIASEYTFTNIFINGELQAGASGTVVGAVAGDCITYAFILELLGENGSACTYTFDVTVPACTTSAIVGDCTTIDYCTVNTPTVSYSCDSGGTITVTSDPGAEAAILFEETEWSTDGVIWTTFVSSFETPTTDGYIRYTVDYDDGCDQKEVIITYSCVIDCEGTFDYNCQYIEGNDTFVATFTDDTLVPILTDTIEYFVDGGLVGTPYVSGTPIAGAGINRVDFRRTIVFDAPCEDKVLDFYCAKVDEDCNYTGYSLTSVYDSMSDSVVPTFTGDESILSSSIKSYTVDGANFDPWLGGAVPTNSFATFVWRIQIVGCEPQCLITTAARSGQEVTIVNDNNNPISIDISNENPISIDISNENPISIDITNDTPIAIDVKNVVQVEGDFCCDEPTGGTDGNGNNCPAPTADVTGVSTIVESTNLVYGTFRTWFSNDPIIDYETSQYTFLLGGNGEYLTTQNVWADADAADQFFELRLNKSGVWVDDPNVVGSFPIGYKVTFGYCLNIPYTGVYSFGFAADNQGILTVDGVQVIKILENADIGAGDTSTMEQSGHKQWYVVERQMTAGDHIITIEAEQGGTGSATSLGFECYNATLSQLKAMTTSAEVDDVVIGSSRDLVQTQDLGLVFGSSGGLTCPDGTTPSFDGCTPVCLCDENYVPPSEIPEGVTTSYTRLGDQLTVEMVGCVGTVGYKWEVDYGGGAGFVLFSATQTITPTQAGLYRPVGICDLVDVPGEPIFFSGFWEV